MKSLPEVAAANRDANAVSGRQFNGGRVLGASLAILAVLATVLLLTRTQDKPSPTPADHQQSANLGLTDSQAIAKFKELNHLRFRAFRSRDPSLLSQVLTSDSPLLRRAYRDIAKLRKDDVYDKTTFTTKSVLLRSSGPTEIQLRELAVQRPLFVSEAGKDISRSHRPILLTVDWTLRREGSSWKIFDSSVIHAHSLHSTK